MYADSFEDILYEWTGHMDYQRFAEADKAYLKLNKICDESLDETILIECSVADILYKYFRADNPDEDEEIVKKLFEILREIKKKSIFSAGTVEIFSLLLNDLNWVLGEDDVLFIKEQIFHQLNSLSDTDIEEIRKDEQRVYLYENLIDLYGDVWLYDQNKIRDYITKALSIIEKTKNDLEWDDWEYGLKMRLLDSFERHEEDAQALKISFELFKKSIELYENKINYNPLFYQLMYFGSLELSNGNDYRSHLYLQLAYSILKEVDEKEIGSDLFRNLDILSYQLLPGFENCDDADEFISFFNKVHSYQKTNQVESEVYQTEASNNSLLTSKLYCSNSEEEQYELANKILINLQNEIGSQINSIYEDFSDEYYIEGVYFKNKLSALYDISDLISKKEYLNVLTLVQEFFYEHAYSDEIFSPWARLEYIEILNKNLCDIRKPRAKKYIKLIEKFVKNPEFLEYIDFNNQMLADLYFDLVLVPSQCGLKNNVRGIFNTLKEARIDINTTNIIAESNYLLNSYRFLGDAIYDDEVDLSSLEYNLRILNREPSEIDLSFLKNSENDNDINAYLKYQSNLNKLDEISLRSSTPSLNKISKNISEILENFNIIDIDTSKVTKYVKENILKEVDTEILLDNLGDSDSLIIYAYTWLNINLNNKKEFLTQTCITRSGIYKSYKELSEKESDLIFSISDMLFKDLVLSNGKAKKISEDYYSVFKSKFKCDPADYNQNNLITNFNEVFNPNIFFKNDYLTKNINFKVFHNIQRYIQEDSSNININKYIGYGGVNYEGSGYKNLPYSHSEIENSSQYFIESKIFTDQNVTKDNIKDSRNSFVHFAVHNDTSIDENKNIYSSLVLSGTDEKRFLFPKDIVNKDFTNSFVVLSACDTFKNSVQGKSTTSNLYNAFLISGAKGILSTTWDIESSSAKQFVSKFFESVSTTKNLSEGFKTAQRNLLDSELYNHPYYWASFNLYH